MWKHNDGVAAGSRFAWHVATADWSKVTIHHCWTTRHKEDTKTANNTSESPLPWTILWWLHIFYCVILFILGDFEVDFEVEVNAC